MESVLECARVCQSVSECSKKKLAYKGSKLPKIDPLWPKKVWNGLKLESVSECARVYHSMSEYGKKKLA